MNGHVEIETAGALLFVRSQGDLDLALEQVNGLLAMRRQRSCPQSEDEVLAVCFRQDLDFGLPTCSEIALTIQNSFSMAGVWTLTWLSGPGLRGARDRVEKQAAIFQAFGELSEPELVGSFCPVFEWDQAPESATVDMKRFSGRYPLLVGPIGFRQDPNGGVYRDETVLLPALSDALPCIR